MRDLGRCDHTQLDHADHLNLPRTYKKGRQSRPFPFHR